MRRQFLFQIATTGLSLMLGRRASRAHSLNLAPGKAPALEIYGKWHLLGEKENEVHIPQHRMDLLFKEDNGYLRGAIINRNDGSEIPLAKVVFTGSTLHVQMHAPSGKDQAEMGTLVMIVSTDHKFEGYWRNPEGAPMGPKLKLIRGTI
jgi:hypothetical protein